MRLAVLADVHDNLPALEAVVEDARRQQVDGIVAAADRLMRGPFARAYLLSIETGRNVVGHLFLHIDQGAAETGHEEWVVVPERVWDQAVSTFGWDDYADEPRS